MNRRFALLFLIAALSMAAFAFAAPIDTSLSVFDAEQDNETQSQSSDARVYVNEWTKFYSNFTNSTGQEIKQTIFRSDDRGTGYSAAKADLDGDGRRQEFVASTNDYLVGYYANGTVAFNKYNVSFDSAYAIYAYDFNNDTHEEIAFMSSIGIFYVVNATNGNTTFASPDYGTGYTLKCGDLDDDSRQDDCVVGASNVSTFNNYGIVAFIYNETSSSFQNIWNKSAVRDVPLEIDMSEIPGEANLVGHVANGVGNVTVYYANGTLKWSSLDLGTTYSLDFFDQDSDGKEDEVAVGEDNELRIYNETGGALYTKTEPYGGEYEVEKYDLDGDGIDDDVLVSSSYNALFAFNSTGSLVWTFYPPIKEFEYGSLTTYYLNIRVGNVTNDTRKDIIVGGYNSRYWILNASGNVTTKHLHRYEENLTDNGYIGITYSDSPGIDIVDDANSDGIDDVLAFRESGFAYLGQQVMCTINISGTVDYMFFNSSSSLWEYDYFFDESLFNKSALDIKNYNWTVLCEKGGYQNRTSSANITVYMKNSSLDIYDQEEDDEDKAGWLSENVIIENETMYFFANFTDLETNSSARGIGLGLQWNVDIGANIYDAAPLDIDGDGIKDGFVYTRLDDFIAYYTSGTSAWNRTNTTYDYLWSVRTGDFNNDSYDEVAVVSTNGYLIVANRSGGVMFTSPDFGVCYSMETGDIDDDGRQDDIAVGCSIVRDANGFNNGTAVFIWNETSSAFENIWNGTQATGPVVEIKISEISGDQNLLGYIDYTGLEKAYVYYSNGSLAWNSSDVGDYASTLEFIDYNQDGKEDEIVIGENGETWLFNSTGMIASHTPSASLVYEVEKIDLDNDGWSNDYVIFERYSIKMHNRTGGLNWSYQMLDDLYGVLAVRDLDDDGEQEIIYGSGYGGFINIYNRSGALLYKYSAMLPSGMDPVEYSHFGYAYYSSGAGMGFLDQVNSTYYMGFAVDNSDIGVLKVFPQCMISFNDSVTARMKYNSSAGLYYYNRSFGQAGPYSWNVTCETESHVTRNGNSTVNVNTAPSFQSVSHSPSSYGEMDPNTTIIVTVNLSDVNRNPDVAVLQWKNNTSNWTDVNMTNTTLKGRYTLFRANFTPSYNSESNYTYRIWSNDSRTASAYSDNYTVAAFWDCTWNITTTGLGIQSGWGENKEIGNITISNTGDSEYSSNNCNLAFHLSHNLEAGRIYFNNWASNLWLTYYDVSSIVAKTNQTIPVNVTFQSEVKEESLTINISEVGSLSETASRTATATLITTRGNPYLYEHIDSVSSSLYLTFNNFTFSGYVRNVVGDSTSNKTAYNVSFNWSLPSGFLVKEGNATLFYGNISDAVPLYNFINLTFNASNLENLTPQTFTIYLYAQGYNTTSELIVHANNRTLLTETANITLSCYNTSDNVYVSACGSLDGDYVATSNATSTSSSSTTSGGAGGGGVTKSRFTTEELQSLFSTTEEFELISGKDNEFTLMITNPFSGPIQDVHLTLTGFLAQYISAPEDIGTIYEGESRPVKIRITAPSYFIKGQYKLNFTMTGVVNETKIKDNMTIRRVTNIKHTRTVILDIHTISREDATALLNNSAVTVASMAEKDYFIRNLQKLIAKAVKLLKEGDYEAVEAVAKQIADAYDQAEKSKTMLSSLKEKITFAEQREVRVDSTLRLTNLAVAAMSRGDFAAAQDRLKEADLTYAIETKGWFNIYFFVKENWPSLAAISIIVILSATMLFFETRLMYLNRSLKNFKREEEILLGLMKTVQTDCFEKKKMSMEEYTQAMASYEDRLSHAVQKIIELETAKAYFFKFGKKTRKLMQEREKLFSLIKQTQDMYMRKKSIETRVYESKMKSYTSRLSEVEENIALEEAQSEIKKKSGFFRLKKP